MDSALFIQQIIADFESRYGIFFEDKNLLIQSLKHRSYLIVSNEPRLSSNERLEFLGDAVLELILTEFLYLTYSESPEGDLSKMKAVLVSRKVLAMVAKKMKLGSLLLINAGEEKIGGRERSGILANAFEAVLGAIYLDKGFKAASDFVHKYLIIDYADYIKQVELKNHKSELLELIQSKNMGMPEYNLVEEEGPDHDKRFRVNVTLAGKVMGLGNASQKKQAEQEAAKNALEKIKKGEIALDLLK